MPQANVWIKQENWEAWQKSTKSDFINTYLENPIKFIGKPTVPVINRPPYTKTNPMVKEELEYVETDD